MNIAYLIAVHDKPDQLKRLIDRLNQPNVSFFVHVDRKGTDIRAFSNVLSGYKNVSIISTRKVYWAGFSQVSATLDLMRLALSSAFRFKYYVLLSGQDYPIKPNSYINSFFEKHDTDFLSYNRIKDLPESFAEKFRKYFFMDIPYFNPRDPRRIKSLVYLHFGINNRLYKLLPVRKYKNFEPYFGSNWFALTNATVQYVLDFVSGNKDYTKFMRYAGNPDELFFQTIILNSDRKYNLYDYNKYVEWLKNRRSGDVYHPEYSSLRFMDWSDRGPDKPKPATLDTSYFDALKTSKELFARKFDILSSAEVLDRIDAELLL